MSGDVTSDEMTIGRPEGNRSIIEQYAAFF